MPSLLYTYNGALVVRAGAIIGLAQTSSVVPNTFVGYTTRFVDAVNGADVPGGNASGYQTIQYGLNDWLVQRARRLVVLPTGPYTLPSNLTFPTDNGSVTTGYRVLEGDVTNPVMPTINTNTFSVVPASPNVAIRYSDWAGLGNVPGLVQQGPIIFGFCSNSLVEACRIHDQFDNGPAGSNTGGVYLNQGGADSPDSVTINQCHIYNIGQTTPGSGRVGCVYGWQTTNTTITNCTFLVWSRAFYYKLAATGVQGLTFNNNYCVGDPISVDTQTAHEGFGYDTEGNTQGAANNIEIKNNFFDGLVSGGVTIRASGGITGALGVNNVIANNTIGLNCNSGMSLAQTSVAVRDNFFGSFGAHYYNRPELVGSIYKLSLASTNNVYYMPTSPRSSAWIMRKYGPGEDDSSTFAQWQLAYSRLTAAGYTDLAAPPDTSPNAFTLASLAGVFNNVGGGDYTLAPGSPLIGASSTGGNIGCYDGSGNTVGATWI